MASQHINVLVLGASLLSVPLVDYLFKSGHSVSIVTRNASKADKFKDKAKVLVGHVTDKEFMRMAFKGIHTVISTIGDSVLAQPIRDQNGIIGLAAECGVQHFIPAMFSPSLNVAGPNVDAEYLGAKEEGLNLVKNSGMKWTGLYAGLFTEFWLEKIAFDFDKCKASLVGDGTNVTPWLVYQDVAQYIALSVNNPAAINQEFCIGTENYTFDQVLHIVEQVTGNKFEVTRTSPEELLKQYHDDTSGDEEEKSFKGLKHVVSKMGPTDLAVLQAAFPKFKTTTSVPQFVADVSKKHVMAR